jgi:hypothetical protein
LSENQTPIKEKKKRKTSACQQLAVNQKNRAQYSRAIVGTTDGFNEMSRPKPNPADPPLIGWYTGW